MFAKAIPANALSERLIRVSNSVYRRYSRCREDHRLQQVISHDWPASPSCDPGYLAQSLLRDEEPAGSLYRLILAHGRFVSCCTDQYETLLAPHTLALATSVQSSLRTLIDWAYDMVVHADNPNRVLFGSRLLRGLDQFVRSLLRTRLTLFSALSMSDFRFYTLAPSNVPVRQLDGAQLANRICHESVFQFARLNGLVRDLAQEAQRNWSREGRGASHFLRLDTLRDLNTTRLELAQRLYRTRAPRLLSENELPSVLSGVMEGLDPNEVRAGLARTVALAGGTDFGVDVPTPNGVIADWLDDHAVGTEALLTDLRRSPSATGCPTLIADDQFGPLPDDVPVW